jgi:hypothetical protein
VLKSEASILQTLPRGFKTLMKSSQEILDLAMNQNDRASFESLFFQGFRASRYDERALVEAFYFAANGSPKVLELLIPLCRPVYRVALMQATIHGQTECVKILLRLMPTQSGNIGNALSEAAWNGDLSCLELMLPLCDSLARGRALIDAADGGQLHTLLALLASLDPHDKASIKQAALAASKSGHAECLRALLERHPTPFAKELLNRAAKSESVDCLRLLFSLKPAPSPSHALIYSAGHGWTDAVRFLLAFPISQRAASQALSAAARRGSSKCVELLIPAARVSAKHCLVVTDLQGNLDCLRLLLPIVLARLDGSTSWSGRLRRHWARFFLSRALLQAAANAHVQQVELLLSAPYLNLLASHGTRAIERVRKTLPPRHSKPIEQLVNALLERSELAESSQPAKNSLLPNALSQKNRL